MFARQGFRADPVQLQVSFGRGEATFWNNVFPTRLLAQRLRREVARFARALGVVRRLEVLLGPLPLRLVLRLFRLSGEFADTVALPMTALFLGTGNATPEVPAAMLERLCTSPTYGMWYPAKPDTVVDLDNRPPMIVFPKLSEFYEAWRKDLVSRGVT